jgi:hypothetical protein
MSPATWQVLSTTGALADLSSHVRLRLSGPDAIRYLNGQVTNDVRKLQPGLALPACVTNHKGKLEAWVHLTQAPDRALRLSAPADLLDFLPLRLEKYLIADDCVLEDVTGATILLHLIAPLEKITPWLAEEEQPAAVSRFGPPGYDLWSTPERLAHWQEHFPTLAPEDLSTLEVLHAVPAWLAGLIFRRSLSLSEAWKLCAAGTLIGGTVLGAALFGYSVRLFPWPVLAAAAAAQLVPVWIWTAWAVIERPAKPPKETPRPKAKNPFRKPPAEKGDAKEVRTQTKRKNPFRGGNAG